MMHSTYKKILRGLIWCSVAALIGFFLVRGYFRLTDDFRIANMIYEMPHNPDWEISSLTPLEEKEVDAILSQPFTYVGKGAQSYVFASEDGKYVIKFFKFKHLKPSWIVNHLPDTENFNTYREENIARKKRLIKSVFSGYKLAYDVHRKETGIVFMHLNTHDTFQKNVTVYDKIGWKHQIDLNPIVFVLQEKAIPTRQVMSEALDRGDVALAKKRIDQIIDLYLQEYQKGIYDRDHGVLHNTGFVGERPIHLDVGKLSPEPKMRELETFKPDLIKVAKKYEIWLSRHYPREYPELMAHIEERLKNKNLE